jgi:hypothetical protein
LRLSGAKKLKVGTSSIWRFYDRHEITFKKTLHAAERDRPDVAAARAALKAEQPSLKAPRLVFIDETAVTTKMVRYYGPGCDAARPASAPPEGKFTRSSGLRHFALAKTFLAGGWIDFPARFCWLPFDLLKTRATAGRADHFLKPVSWLSRAQDQLAPKS